MNRLRHGGKRKGARKTGGRRKGSRNKVTLEVRAAASILVDDPTYRTNLARRLRAGTLAPAMETMLWYYAKGKPIERHEFIDASKLSTATIEAIIRESGETPGV